MNNALKDVFGPMIEEMLKAKLDYHLGYENNSKSEKETANRRNGYNSLCAIRRQFESAVQSVVDDIACYSSDPIADFSRNRKLPAHILIPLIIQMGSASLPTELANFFDDPKFSVTASAFCQQRSKLDPEAFLHILHLMSFSRSPSLLKGYRVLAMDGSDVLCVARQILLVGNVKYFYTHLEEKRTLFCPASLY
ncbi:hypothetical protein AAK706_13120, partial [Erysipelotrichaceae bacterium 66-17]